MFRFLALSFLALGVSGCAILDSEAPIRVFVAVSRSTFLPGDSTTISVIVTNQTDHLISVSATCDFLGFEVLDSAGEAVVPRRGCARQASVLYDLQPGEALSKHLIWWGDRQDGEPLAAGTYRVVGDVRAEQLRSRSAPVRITLIAAR